MRRWYTAPDGTKFPLVEAKYDMLFKCYKSDRRKAMQGNPNACLLALGIKRHPDVLDIYIGSGKDAYVIFKGDEGEAPQAVHFTVATAARKVVDAFDKDKTTQSCDIVLRRPTKSWTLAYRRKNGAKWRDEVKTGERQPKRRGKINEKRVTRLGVAHRPRAKVTRGGSVNVSA